MLSRKEQTNSGTFLPDQWREKVEETLLTLYQEQCQREKKSFQVYGLTYPNEVFLAVSYLDLKNLNKLPVTYVASADLEKERDSQKLFNLLVDSIGLFYDSFFSDRDGNGYLASWTKTQLKEQVFYYKVTREVISLTIEADKILASEVI